MQSYQHITLKANGVFLNRTTIQVDQSNILNPLEFAKEQAVGRELAQALHWGKHKRSTKHTSRFCARNVIAERVLECHGCHMKFLKIKLMRAHMIAAHEGKGMRIMDDNVFPEQNISTSVDAEDECRQDAVAESCQDA